MLDGIIVSISPEAMKYPDMFVIEKAFSITESEIKTKKKLESMWNTSQQTFTGLGEAKGVEHSIKLVNVSPITCKAYKILLPLQAELKTEIGSLFKKQIIRASQSEYSSPVFVIRKKDKSLRLLIDYRRLNKNTIKEEYSFPEIDNLLSGLYGKQVFNTINLKQEYYQIKMSKAAIKYTAFDLPFKRYKFLRMPFGLSNAPKSFQKAMMHALRGLDFVRVYLDDILVASNNIEEHCDYISQVLDRLKNFGFTINFEKSKLGLTRVTF